MCAVNIVILVNLLTGRAHKPVGFDVVEILRLNPL